MASDDHELWYRLGHALERIREGSPVHSVLETLKDLGDPGRGGSSPITGILSGLPLRRRTGVMNLVASAVAGAGAVALVEAATRLIRRESVSDLDRNEALSILLSGAGRGVTFGGVIEPRIPGPAFLAGFVYGTAEYLTASWGGLSGLLGSRSPHTALPFLARAVDEKGDDGADFIEHLAFGLALALLYDSLRRNSGIDEDE